MNLEDWVEKAENKTDAEFRKAINIVLKAIATNEKLSHSMAFKGGLLLGIKYENLRYTTDLDFSTPDTRPGDIENFKEHLDLILSLAESDLAYGLKCKWQKFPKSPK